MGGGDMGASWSAAPGGGASGCVGRVAAAQGRAEEAPLLLQSDGRPWDRNPGQNYHRQVDNVVTGIGLDPAEVTMYALRHSSIVRMLLRNVPIRLVASLHNTSVAMIEKHYSRYITEHSIDDIARTSRTPGGARKLAVRPACRMPPIRA